DITDRTRVVDRAEFVLPIEQAELAGDRVIVRGIDGFRIFSIDEPFAPQELAMVPVSEPGEFGADTQTIYFAMNGTLQKIDLATPVIEGTDMRVTSPMQLSAVNGKIVIADRYSLRIYGPATAPPPPPPPAKRRSAGS
ncbi:MAG TPA: hypothetical protein VMU84_04550, partial [Thermoanaerobaculia bacterium]|nr:hypothetical protein [Thermoanaerobaculia bacterium]